MTRSLVILASAAIATAGCIERPTPVGSQSVEVDRSTLKGVLLTSAPSPQHPVGARFDRGIELIGYDVDPEPAQRGARATVTFYFRATENVGQDWQIFIHADDTSKSAGRVLRDHYPAEGKFRTSAWKAGDIIKDSFSLPIPAMAGGMEIWTGFYQGNDRLELLSAGRGQSDGNNRVRVGVIPLK